MKAGVVSGPFCSCPVATVQQGLVLYYSSLSGWILVLFSRRSLSRPQQAVLPTSVDVSVADLSPSKPTALAITQCFATFPPTKKFFCATVMNLLPFLPASAWGITTAIIRTRRQI